MPLYIAVVGKITKDGQSSPAHHRGSFVNSDRSKVIEQALLLKKQWEQPDKYSGVKHGPYQVMVGELSMEVQLVEPIVEYKQVPISV